MRALLRLAGLKEYLRSSLWVLPALFVAVAIVMGSVLGRWDPDAPPPLQPLVFGGSAEAARELLSTLAGAMITVTGLTFSLTVVALQMAAGQYSPRVLRGFLSDRGVQLVLSTLVGTFAYCVAVLRVVRDDGGEGDLAAGIAVTVGVLVSLVALGALVYFLHHVTRQLRVETILAALAADTLDTIDRVHPDPLDGGDAPAPPEPTDHAVRVPAARSGYLQAVERRGLLRQATQRGVVVRIRPPVGRHVTEGTTMAEVWRTDGSPLPPGEPLDRLVHDRVQLGPERTLQQDVSFGLRQIVDIAVKALSTGMNDPTTAVESLGQLAVVMSRLATRRLGSIVERDEGGAPRAVVPRPGFAEYLHLCCDQPRRYGAADPVVLLAVLDLLLDVAEHLDDTGRRQDVEDQVARTLTVAREALDAADVERVERHAALVRRTLAGERNSGRGLLPA